MPDYEKMYKHLALAVLSAAEALERLPAARPYARALLNALLESDDIALAAAQPEEAHEEFSPL